MKYIKVFSMLLGLIFLLANNALATTSSQILVMSNQLYQIARDLTTGILPTSILLIAIHYLRIYGNAVLLSLMGAGYDILNKKAEQLTDPRETVAASIGQKLADVSERTLEKNMDVQPTLIIDPGYKFKIIVMKDMVLEAISDAAGALTYTK